MSRGRIQNVLRHRALRLVGLFCLLARATDAISAEPPQPAPPLQEPATQKPATPAASADAADLTSAEIKRWIAELDHNQFEKREAAQQQLTAAGQTVLPAVAEVARHGNLECSTRALNIMLAWSESKDHGLRIASLEQLVTLLDRPREAHAAAKLLAYAHEQAALADIVAMGGSYRPARGIFGDGQQRLQIVIDAQWKGGDAGLQRLTEVTRASTISFYLAPVYDEGLEQLTQMPSLQRVELYGTPVSPEVLAKLKMRIPDVDVRKGGAQLGIEGIPGNRVPSIAKMVEGGAAERAGLELGDSIIELNGEEIKDFHDLTDRIAQFRPGDGVELTIVRKGQQVKKEVTFDSWSAKNSDPSSLIGPGQVPGIELMPEQKAPLLDRR